MAHSLTDEVGINVLVHVSGVCWEHLAFDVGLSAKILPRYRMPEHFNEECQNTGIAWRGRYVLASAVSKSTARANRFPSQGADPRLEPKTVIDKPIGDLREVQGPRQLSVRSA